MAVLVRGGTVVNADRSFRADVLCDGGKIVAVGARRSTRPPAPRSSTPAARFVMPGRHRPAHPHGAALHGHGGGRGLLHRAPRSAPGRRHHHDHRLRACPRRSSLTDGAATSGASWAKKACADYCFHVAITWWNERTPQQMAECLERGVNSFKHFMAYKVRLMVDDETHVAELRALPRARRLADRPCRERRGRVPPAAAAAEPRASPAPRATAVAPAACRGRGRQPGDHASPRIIGVPLYIVHTSCREIDRSHRPRPRRRPARVRRGAGQPPGARRERLPQPDWDFAASRVMSPPFRSKEHQEALWDGLQSGTLQTTATDHCAFCARAEEDGQGRLHPDPERHRRDRGPACECSGTSASAPAG